MGYERIREKYRAGAEKRYGEIFREGTCDLCGRPELTVLTPTDWFFFCYDHAMSIPNLDSLAQRGLVYLAPNVGGTLKCHVCGRVAPVLYAVKFERLCWRCMWYGLGQMSRRLKVATGDRIV